MATDDLISPAGNLNSLRWLELDITLRNVRVHRGQQARNAEIVEAICKGTLNFVCAEVPGAWWLRLRDTPWQGRPKAGQTLAFTLCAAGFAEDQLALVGQLLPAALNSGKPWKYTGKSPPANYAVEHSGEVRTMSLAALAAISPALPAQGEIALNFVSPLPTRRYPGRDRLYLPVQAFFGGLQQRAQTLFATVLPDISIPTGLQLHSQFMSYTEVAHLSRSQNKQPQSLAGLRGIMLLKGDLAPVRDWLLLGTAINAGQRISNARGQYQILLAPQAILDRQFPDPEELVDVLHDLVEQDDELAQEFLCGTGFEQGERAWAQELAELIRAGGFAPEPRREVYIGSKGHSRPIGILTLRDKVVETALYRLLRKPLDVVLEPESMGFRKGRSREQALALVHKAIERGNVWVIESDIEGFFPSIDHGALRDLLSRYLAAGDVRIQGLLESLLVAPVVRDGKTVRPRSKGLLQGSPLSPLLANLYLDSFDEAVKRTGARFVRYADDFVVLCTSREQAEMLLVGIRRDLDNIGLRLKTSKTAIIHLQGEQILEFLGEKIAASEAPEEGEAGMSPRKPVYITRGWQFLALKDNRLEVRDKGELRLSVPLQRLSSINLLGPASMSTALVARCVRQGIPVSMALDSGYPMATVRPDNRSHYDLIAAHGRLHQSLSEREIATVAGTIVQAKLVNYACWLGSRRLSALAPIVAELRSLADKAVVQDDVDQVRGLEGYGATLGFDGLRIVLAEPDFAFRKRLRRPADRINSLLNFGYYLLFSRINGGLRSAGLNPYLGFLHSSQNRYESLVCDIQELFRPYIDRLVVSLVNKKMITAADFVEGHRGLRLSHTASARFVEQYERAMLAPAGPLAGGHRLPLGRCMDTQVAILKGWVLERNDLSLFRWGE